MGRNFVSGICKLKTWEKKLKNLFKIVKKHKFLPAQSFIYARENIEFEVSVIR